jgi:hypothetical protein
MDWNDKVEVAEYNKKYRADHKEQSRASKKRWRDKNKGKIDHRKHNIKKKYGISMDEWNALFISQGSRCAICSSEQHKSTNWHTDHCHTTGIIRGILCGPCNTGLGKLGDSADRVFRAFEYLRKHDTRRAA